MQIFVLLARLARRHRRLLHSGRTALRHPHRIPQGPTTLAGFVLRAFRPVQQDGFSCRKEFARSSRRASKVLVLAVVVGIGSTLFCSSHKTAETAGRSMMRWPDFRLRWRCSGLSIFGPGSRPVLLPARHSSARARAVGTALAAGGLGVAGARSVQPASLAAIAGVARGGGAIAQNPAGAWRLWRLASVRNRRRRVRRVRYARRNAGLGSKTPAQAGDLDGLSTAAHSVRSGDHAGGSLQPHLPEDIQ